MNKNELLIYIKEKSSRIKHTGDNKFITGYRNAFSEFEKLICNCTDFISPVDSELSKARLIALENEINSAKKEINSAKNENLEKDLQIKSKDTKIDFLTENCTDLNKKIDFLTKNNEQKIAEIKNENVKTNIKFDEEKKILVDEITKLKDNYKNENVKINIKFDEEKKILINEITKLKDNYLNLVTKNQKNLEILDKIAELLKEYNNLKIK